MVKLRLKRIGSKFNAFYRIIAADSRAPRDGKFIEEIGYYNPYKKKVFINEELKSKWELRGAKSSQTVKTLFKKVAKAKSQGNIQNNIVFLEKKSKKIKSKQQKNTMKETLSLNPTKDKSIKKAN